MRTELRLNRLLWIVPAILVAGILAVVAHPQKYQAVAAYHMSQWNAFAPEIERAIVSQTHPTGLTLAHIYGGVVSHHIPTTIPKLVAFYRRLKKTQTVKNIIVIGPDHTDAGKASITISNESFFTTFGEVRPIAGLPRKLEERGLAHIEEKPFDPEHSVGSQILVLSRIFPEARLTPIIVRSDTSLAAALSLAEMLAANMDDETILIASVDFSHYLSTDQAMPIDRLSGEVVRNLDLNALSRINADSNKSMAVFIKVMQLKNATTTEDVTVLNTNDLMQNSDYTTGYVFGYWGTARK